LFQEPRASTVPKTVTASAASKPATTHPSSTVAAIIISKPAQPQNTPLLVLLAFKPKPKVKLFIQAVKANNITQQVPRLASISSHEDFLQLFQLKEAFPNLLQATIISMYQTSLGDAGAS